MSTKTRKKSPKASPTKAPRAASKTSPEKRLASGKIQLRSKPAKKVARTATKPPARALHKATSKKLKLPAPRVANPTRASPAPVPIQPTTPVKNAAVPRASPVKASASLTEGSKAPAFDLPRDGGARVSLRDYSGRKLVIFFYPRADTPGCTKEAIDFTRLFAAFEAAQTAVIGVSADSPKAQESFKIKHQLGFPLLSDEQHETLKAYGAWGEKSMYGRTFQGVLRTTVLIASNSKIARIWRNVKVDGHADQVLETARTF